MAEEQPINFAEDGKEAIDAATAVEIVAQALYVLAATADQQLAVIPKGDHAAEEISLLFEDALLQAADVKGAITPAQKDALNAVDTALDKMSRADKASMWTEKALRTEAAWADVRKLASAAVKALGRTLAAPDPSKITGH
eukprot:m51a1_g12205 hypothetical protein (140) ;mRNA; r:2803-3396